MNLNLKCMAGTLIKQPLLTSEIYKSLVTRMTTATTGTPVEEEELPKPLEPVVDIDIDDEIYKDLRPRYSQPLPSDDADAYMVNEELAEKGEKDDVAPMSTDMEVQVKPITEQPRGSGQIKGQQEFKGLGASSSLKILDIPTSHLWHVNPEQKLFSADGVYCCSN